MNMSKTELNGFGCTPSPIQINNYTVSPSTSIKFLGLTITALHVYEKFVHEHWRAWITKAAMGRAHYIGIIHVQGEN